MSTLLQLRTNVKNVLADNTTTDQRWSDSELTTYANNGENEACKRAHVLIDSTTAAIVTITTVTGTSIYTISDKILKIPRAIMTGGTKPLIQTTKRALDLSYPSWESDSGAIRSFFVGDTNKITVYKNPSAGGTLNLTVSRLPTTAMSADGDTPEIDEQYHKGIELWMLHEASQKQDSKTLDVDKSVDYERMFNEFFGIRPPVPVQREKKK